MRLLDPLRNLLRRQPSSTKPQTTAKLLDRLRSIDWFQFEKLVGLIQWTRGCTVTRRGGANSCNSFNPSTPDAVLCHFDIPHTIL